MLNVFVAYVVGALPLSSPPYHVSAHGPNSSSQHMHLFAWGLLWHLSLLCPPIWLAGNAREFPPPKSSVSQ